MSWRFAAPPRARRPLSESDQRVVGGSLRHEQRESRDGQSARNQRFDQQGSRGGPGSRPPRSHVAGRKIGQLNQVEASADNVLDLLGDDIRAGQVGSIINQVDRDTVLELQRIAREESRLGIPLLVGRDVIHGFKTVVPLPIGQAASWNPQLVEACARLASEEASTVGVNWTFAPMIDVCRDPRWGRIAECLGEDPVLTSVLGAAMVRGFQGASLDDPSSLAACAKHFAGYGASESGRDYNTTNLPENELRNVHFPPFRAAVEAGVASLMTSFSDIDGVPATANSFLLRDVLREEWRYDGLVVSDWDAIQQLCVHGLTETRDEAAFRRHPPGSIWIWSPGPTCNTSQVWLRAVVSSWKPWTAWSPMSCD